MVFYVPRCLCGYFLGLRHYQIIFSTHLFNNFHNHQRFNMKRTPVKLLLLCSASVIFLLLIISWIQSPHSLNANKFAYRDLNKNGKMDVYEDSRQPIEARINDILQQMTLEEKAGMLFINGARVNADGS